MVLDCDAVCEFDDVTMAKCVDKFMLSQCSIFTSVS